MTFTKRMLLTLSAFIVLVVGSFSFMSAGALSSPSFDSNPFFVNMPQLPDGYFDGDILYDTTTYGISLNFGGLTSEESGTIHSEGLDRYTFSFPSTTITDNYIDFEGYLESPYISGTTTNGSSYDTFAGSISGSGNNDEIYFNGSGDVELVQSGGTGTISQTANGDDSYSGSTSYSGGVSGNIQASKDTLDHKRFRCFSCVFGASNYSEYRYFVIDARNKIYSTFNSDSSVLTIHADGGYPSYVIRFNLNGTVLGSATIPSYFGWSAPNGIWISDSFPPLPLGSSAKFRDAVFGKEALLFSYLHSLESDLNQIHTDIGSLQTAMQSSISNQTTAFQNMDAASGFDPTAVENMLNYGSLVSNYHAPSTDDIFSLSGGSYTDGMGWWRDRLNELLYFSGSPVLPMTIFTLTLGLAVLVIGRRVSGGGSA